MSLYRKIPVVVASVEVAEEDTNRPSIPGPSWTVKDVANNKEKSPPVDREKIHT